MDDIFDTLGLGVPRARSPPRSPPTTPPTPPPRSPTPPLGLDDDLEYFNLEDIDGNQYVLPKDAVKALSSTLSAAMFMDSTLTRYFPNYHLEIQREGIDLQYTPTIARAVSTWILEHEHKEPESIIHPLTDVDVSLYWVLDPMTQRKRRIHSWYVQFIKGFANVSEILNIDEYPISPEVDATIEMAPEHIQARFRQVARVVLPLAHAADYLGIQSLLELCMAFLMGYIKQMGVGPYQLKLFISQWYSVVGH